MTKEKIPDFRFSGYTDAWEERKLGEIGTVAMNKRIFKEQTSANGDIPFFKIGTFGGRPDAYISRELFEEYKEKYPYPNEGDLLISASGSIGRIVEYKGEDAYYQDSNIVWLNHSGNLNNLFLKQFYENVTWEGIEGTTIKRLYNKNILNTQIVLPSLPEQESIGNFFRQLDDLLTLHERKLDLLKEHKKTYLRLLFPAKGQKVPALRFDSFEGDWEEKKVGEIFKVTRGQVLSATKVSKIKDNKNQYPVYSSQTQNNGLLGYYSECLFNDAITWTTDGANAGTVNFRKGKFYSTNVNGVLLSESGYANKMVAEILNSVAWKFVSKVGNPKLMNNVMSEITLSLPSLPEQEAIGNFFSTLDEEITQVEKKLASLKTMKATLLRKLFV
ncbi:restriction endonuclease subunit S [Streptococcus dysgalactiae]|uniref:restriction endonuclease subunit S n=6 Tax=Streptococcus dysgalactiae TaxID=1334 RepID=UPI001CF30BFE|nr:restriction endonuclease subunit S [Streptococcus dysgalactiae]MCB2828656.1 restriction endonuclease subunit S [Streptococcus dysgalactiae subsp. dysgalactiae]MCB2831218.1 restriction endonuclease subunit S [Streptococcus dysgalactiae subsp. dysgalactiae]MCB2834853.1 restriction endonuclease subunit S [Streptococcus dysgalactiae subsp. dysgalactiae]MCB2836389.1 restriction endonuclease subunit S [Streptococcus dysgalactiae subsp. dysgalactiae]MCB2838408.1 restriction endonuclease subunit S 